MSRIINKRFLKRVFAAVSVCLMLTAATACSTKETDGDKDTTETASISGDAAGTALNVWYTDAGMSDYMNAAVQAYEQENGIEVNALQVSSVEYLEAVNQKNIDGADQADVYILNSEALEKAYMAGLAKELEPEDGLLSPYSQTAVAAVTYQDKILGYPFYFETSFFLYNKNMVDSAPDSFQAIIDFSFTDYMAASEGETSPFEGMETILEWNVLDLFYNYGFAGAYLNLGGSNGDDRSVVDINNEQLIQALSFYKQLNQSLYFDAAEVDYNALIERFLNGAVLYTIGGTNSLRALEASEFAYGISPLPSLTDELDSKSVSVNYIAVVNPYSKDTEQAGALAAFITDSYTEQCYALSGKLPCKRLDSYPNEEFEHVMDAYENSAQMPKLLDTTNFWVELEVAMNNIWKAEMDEEEAEENLSDASQADATGVDEWKKQKQMEQIREIVTEEINRVQHQMELQLQ